MSDMFGALDVQPALRGNVERFDGRILTGWASDGSSEPLRLRIVANGEPLYELVADIPRDDVVAAGFAQTGSGFAVEIPRPLFTGQPCVIEVYECRFDIPISGSPVQIDARPPETSEPKDASLASLSAAVVEATEVITDVRQLQANVALILTWLQKNIDRANLLAASEALRFERLNAVIGELGGLQGCVGQLYGVIQQTYPQLLFARSTSPRVSIVIPTHNKFQLTYNCVESIVNSQTSTSYEIIIVDDCSSDETLLASLIFMGGCKVIRTPKNEGFVGACNLGIASATGEFVIFLNNDTIVNDGWLDALVETLDRDPRIGVVGSRLLFADGVLQESGGIIWRDGSAWNWGRGQDKMNPLYSFMRDADYVSGAALMIRRDLLQQLGGFDEYFAPAYYEDTDLCFRARAAGYRVVVQPKSTIIHLEGQSNGTSTSSGLKRYQVVNARKFHNRWRKVLDGHAMSGQSPTREAERGVRKRALFIDETTPTPDQDAGSNAALEHMLSLQRLGYKLIFLPADNMANIPKYTEDLQALGVECWYAPFAWSVEEYFRRNERNLDLVYIHRKVNLQRYLHLVQKYVPNAKMIFNYADIHALRELRAAEIEGAPPERIAAIQLALKTEIDLAAQADAVIVHSTFEAETIRARQPNARVHPVPWTFKTKGDPILWAGRSGVAFVGGFGHPPNVDAVDWFVADIWPAVASLVAPHPFRIVGSKMPPRFDGLRRGDIEPIGYVEDLDTLLDQTLITVAPLRYGAGLKGKVLSSLARGVPCVMTPVAAEGMNLPEDLSGLVAQDAVEFGYRIIELCDDRQAWNMVSHACVNFVRERFSEQEIDRLMRETVRDASRPRDAGRSSP